MTAAGSQGSSRVSLRAKSGRGGVIAFFNNPATLKLSTTAKAELKPTAASSPPGTPMVMQANELLWGEVGLTPDAMYLVGPDTQQMVEQLMAWANPAVVDEKTTSLEPLIFEWGRIRETVKLKSVTATYEKFRPDGTPLRASCAIVLQVAPEANQVVDPNAQAIAGSSSKALVQGDSLQSVADAKYGDPQQWRQVADANGVDDPMRMQPGAVVNLPSRQALTSAAGSA